VRNLAAAMNKPIDLVFEAMLYVEGADIYDQPGSPIENMKVLDGIIKRCGFRPEHIRSPMAKVAEILQEVKRESECDIKPRLVICYNSKNENILSGQSINQSIS
jgi:hypothetical protein